VLFEQLHRQQDQVVKVHCVVGLERALVVGVDDGCRLLLGVARIFQRLGRQDQVVFPRADHVLDFVDPVVARVFLLHDVGHQRFDVSFVKDRETRLVTQPRMLLADNVQPQVVERAHRQATTFTLFKQGADTLFHLAGGFIGKRHGDDVLGTDATVLDQVRDFAGNHAGFAGARAGEHQ